MPTKKRPDAWRRHVPHVAAAIDYATDVCSGKIPACVFARQACERALTDLETQNFLYGFDIEKAEFVCDYIETLPHVKGEWAQRRELLELQAWQSFIVTNLFGWVYAEDIERDGDVVARAGNRRFKTAYIEVPRKNSKTTTAAGIGLYMLEADGEEGAEVVSAATTRSQAKLTFAVAQAMARRVTGLDVRAHSISNVATSSKFEALHAQGNTLDGLNISCAINDELHAWKKRSVYDVIETATGARSQPLIFNITTAGANIEGVCYDVRGYGLRVLRQEAEDDSFFALIYTIDEQDDWLDRASWRKANPNWGVSVYPMDIEALARKAKELPSEQAAFMTKRLNVWVNAASPWMDMMRWNKCVDPRLKIEDFIGEPCYGGIDLASRIDVNSLAILFSREINGVMHYYAFMRHWLPEEAIKSDRFGVYDGWVRSGHMLKTPGNVIDVDAIEEETAQIAKTHSLVELGVDPGHNSTQYAVHMAQAGVRTVDVRPNVMNFSDPMKWLEAWVKDGTFHTNCPVLSWMISNVIAKMDNKDNIYPRKENASRKIDGAIALFIAINRLKAYAPPKHQMFIVG